MFQCQTNFAFIHAVNDDVRKNKENNEKTKLKYKKKKKKLFCGQEKRFKTRLITISKAIRKLSILSTLKINTDGIIKESKK